MKLEDRRYKIEVIVESDCMNIITCKKFTTCAIDAIDACSKTDYYMQNDLGYNYFSYHIMSVTPVDTTDIKVDAEVEE